MEKFNFVHFVLFLSFLLPMCLRFSLIFRLILHKNLKQKLSHPISSIISYFLKFLIDFPFCSIYNMNSKSNFVIVLTVMEVTP